MMTINTASSDAGADRRTFAIISHPDAGKTTLTEKLLYFAGAIRLAGHIRSRGEQRRTQSDWLAMERARGISVSSSVMTFEHAGLTFNLLDTPGHHDFSEDTYRTLSAVDSAIMVIDAAKGIESQTRKLFEVCRLRDIPIITFINKMDREGRDPLELLDEIESTLALDVSPITWPVGSGVNFYGSFDLLKSKLYTSSAGRGGAYDRDLALAGLHDPELDRIVPPDVVSAFRDSAELAFSVYPEFDPKSFLQGHMTPVLFGSALKDFPLPRLLEVLAEYAPPPQPQPAEPRPIRPEETRVTGFVFKVQANMDANHRDRVAFVRLCSGRFRRGMRLKHVRSGRALAVNNPIFFFARERDLAEEAYPGDIIGIPNHGTLRVGDALCEGDDVRFTGLPNFAPEVLRRIRLDDPIRGKQLKRALNDFAEEGVTQVFDLVSGNGAIIGAVGQLQLDVLSDRMQSEYGIRVGLEPAPYATARWIRSKDESAFKLFIERERHSIARDRDGEPVFLARNAWELSHTKDKWPAIEFLETRERSS
jgi:peptide chain release factor 3